MRNRIKELYLDLGRVLNNPEAFGLGERMPIALRDALTRMESELMEELREQGLEHDFLAQELSQDADRHAFPGFTSTSFELPKRGK
ncbi:MAG TPA: hypothetical protein VFR84_07075 [Candidatus Angelobacter sp.]|nr:hypothetical protein [Candidatus Angelobacter sp.]